MVAAEFIELVKKWKFESDYSLADFADTISSFWTILVGLICTMIVTVKVYAMNPIVCHAPVTFSGSDFGPFINNYCFVEGSVAIPHKQVVARFPQTEREWREYEAKGFMAYYPWVPLFMSFTALIPFLVSTMWKVFYTRRAGTDYQNMVDMAVKAQTQDGEDRHKTIERIVNGVVDTLTTSRDYRHGSTADIRSRLCARLHLGLLRRRVGSWINVTYFLVKMAYLASHLAILVAIHFFLALKRDYALFGVRVLVDLMAGRYWEETGVFPRVTFCRIPIKHNRVNSLVAQCAVPVNLLNEAIFVFVWFWHAICLLVMLLSLMVWLFRALNRPNKEQFVRKALILSGIKTYAHGGSTDGDTRVFTGHFLQQDGVFLLRMLDTAVGCSVTTDVVAGLWRRFARIKDWSRLPKPVRGRRPRRGQTSRNGTRADDPLNAASLRRSEEVYELEQSV